MLMPNLYSQFVVNPTAALSIQYLPGTEIAEEKKKGGGGTWKHSRQIHQYKTPHQHGAVSLRCFTQNQVLQKEKSWLLFYNYDRWA